MRPSLRDSHASRHRYAACCRIVVLAVLNHHHSGACRAARTTARTLPPIVDIAERQTLMQRRIQMSQTPTDSPSSSREMGVSRTTDRERNPHAETDLLYRFEGRLTFVPIGLVAEGLRMANPFAGIVTEGILEGGHLWGTDHLLVLKDGVSVIDAQKIVVADDRRLYEHVHGYCIPPAGFSVPPLETLLDSNFAWPDAVFPIVGFSTFRTAIPELAHLNRARARIDGWCSFADGRLAVSTRLVDHDATAPKPTRWIEADWLHTPTLAVL